MIKIKKRIVIFLGAGFPIPWGAPTSDDLRRSITQTPKNSSFSFLARDASFSFEDIVASLYDIIHHDINPIHKRLFRPFRKLDEKEGWLYYSTCINEIIKRVQCYERSCLYEKNKSLNKSLKSLFNYLTDKYRHVSVYTTNYDEITPLILGWKESSKSVADKRFIYALDKHHLKKCSYINLHGSIHLTLGPFDGQQRVICYSPEAIPLTTSHRVYGGNPSEYDLFSPIIVGHNKTQQILAKHFNYPITCFCNDLSDCETFLAIGSSFSDPHLNSIIRQYTNTRPVDYRIITKCDDVLCGSIIDKKICSEVYSDKSTYLLDKKEETILIRGDGKLVYYKRGTEEFLKDESFWTKYI